jgi:hypothetical protein
MWQCSDRSSEQRRFTRGSLVHSWWLSHSRQERPKCQTLSVTPNANVHRPQHPPVRRPRQFRNRFSDRRHTTARQHRSRHSLSANHSGGCKLANSISAAHQQVHTEHDTSRGNATEACETPEHSCSRNTSCCQHRVTEMADAELNMYRQTCKQDRQTFTHTCTQIQPDSACPRESGGCMV